jgi:hypothetical protein
VDHAGDVPENDSDGAGSGLPGFFFELVDRHHEALWAGLKGAFANCFDGQRIVGQTYRGALKLIADVAKHERKLQLLIRGMTDGVISERDRLLNYSVGEFYQELSLFIEEGEARKKYLDSLKTNKK